MTFMKPSHISYHQISQACKLNLLLIVSLFLKLWLLLFNAILLIVRIMQKSWGQQLKWESSLFYCFNGLSQLFVSNFFECFEISVTYYVFSCNLEVFLFPVVKNLSFLGTLAVIHLPSQLETFLVIALALQPCKIPYFNSLFIIFILLVLISLVV